MRAPARDERVSLADVVTRADATVGRVPVVAAGRATPDEMAAMHSAATRIVGGRLLSTGGGRRRAGAL